MVYHTYKKDIVEEYIIEAYRRLYASSVDKNGVIVSFDALYLEAKEKQEKGLTRKIEIKYEDYLCPIKIQSSILDTLLNEPYITPRGVVKNLSKNDRDRVRIAVNLGVSPFSSVTAFIKRNPEFEKFKDVYKEYLDDEL